MVHISVTCGYYEFTKLLFELIFNDRNPRYLQDPFQIIKLEDSVYFGSLSIFKLYTLFNIKEYNVGSALTIVIKKEHIEIIKYMFETEFRQKFQITNNSAYKLLKASLFSTKTDIFSYLLKQLIDVEHIIPDFYNQIITWLLSHACSIGNI